MVIDVQTRFERTEKSISRDDVRAWASYDVHAKEIVLEIRAGG